MQARRFTNRLSLWITGGTAGAFAVAGVALAVQGAWIASLAVASAGFILAATMQTCRTRQTIVVDATGVTVLTGREGRPATHRFAWHDVKATRYAERTLSPWDTRGTVGVFTLEGSTGTLLEVTNQWHEFAGVVAACNDGTPHLLYSWVPRDLAPAGDTLERAGAYCRIARPAAQYSKLGSAAA